MTNRLTYHPAPKSTKHLDSNEKNALARSKVKKKLLSPYGPTDKAPASGAGDSGFEPVWAYFLLLFSFYDSLGFVLSVVKKMAGSTLARPFFFSANVMHAFCQNKVGTMGIEPMNQWLIRPTLYRLSYAPW